MRSHALLPHSAIALIAIVFFMIATDPHPEDVKSTAIRATDWPILLVSSGLPNQAVELAIGSGWWGLDVPTRLYGGDNGMSPTRGTQISHPYI